MVVIGGGGVDCSFCFYLIGCFNSFPLIFIVLLLDCHFLVTLCFYCVVIIIMAIIIIILVIIIYYYITSDMQRVSEAPFKLVENKL